MNHGCIIVKEDILAEPRDIDESVDRTDCLSIVTPITYLARFARPDLSFACGIIATHSSAPPTLTHLRQAFKLLKYIAASDEYVIHYRPQAFAPQIYADASHVIHYDGKGHGFIIAKIGGGIVYVRSYKLKLITLSSTENECMILCEATALAQWIMSLFESFGYALKPIVVRQDNTSSVWLAEHDANFARTKHMLIKKNRAKEGILNGVIAVRITPTEFMVADLGTKPLSLRLLLLLHLKNIGILIAVFNNGRLIRLDNTSVPAVRQQRRIESIGTTGPRSSTNPTNSSKVNRK